MKRNEVVFKIPFYQLVDRVCDGLTEEQALDLIREIDAFYGSWDFTHQLLMYARNTIKEDPDEYRRFLEDTEIVDNKTLIDIMDELGE